MTSSLEKTIWDKLQAVSSLIAATLIPISLAWIGNEYAQATKDKEISLKYVELAVTILKENPSPENNSIRDWAIRLINENTKVKLGEDAERQLNETPIFSREQKSALTNMMWNTFQTKLLANTGASLEQVEKIVAKEKSRILNLNLTLDALQKEMEKIELFYLTNPDKIINPTPNNGTNY